MCGLSILFTNFITFLFAYQVGGVYQSELCTVSRVGSQNKPKGNRRYFRV